MLKIKGSCRVRAVGAASLLAAVAGPLALAGCASLPVVSSCFRLPNAQAFAFDIMASGPLLVSISGDPYGLPPDQLADRVIPILENAVPALASAGFTADPGAAASKNWRIDLSFNVSGPGGRGQCLGSSAGGGPNPSGAVTVSAAFCDGGDLISSAFGAIGRSDGVDDSAFAFLMSQVIQELLPPPEMDRDADIKIEQ